jgi:hypothetical protein
VLEQLLPPSASLLLSQRGESCCVLLLLLPQFPTEDFPLFHARRLQVRKLLPEVVEGPRDPAPLLFSGFTLRVVVHILLPGRLLMFIPTMLPSRRSATGAIDEEVVDDAVLSVGSAHL